jgi:multidrug efflux system membrane fusion protein
VNTNTDKRTNALIAAGLALLSVYTPTFATSNATDKHEPVRVETVRYGDVAYYPEHSTAAEVIASNDSTLSAEIAATVERIAHDTGERVDAGDVLVTLDCRSYNLQLQQARALNDANRAQYENAQQLFTSAELLQKQHNISKELYNQRLADSKRLKAETRNSEAGVEQAKIAVEKCAVKAPYDGYISERVVDVGELVQPGTPLLRLVAADKGLIEAQISTPEYDSFRDGTDHRFVYNGTAYEVTITSLLPVIDSNYRTHKARLAFIGDAAPAGSQGKLSWKDNTLALPSNLVVKRGERSGVLLNDDGIVEFVPIANYIEGHPATIELESDAAIITTGRFGLNAGDAVTTN